MTDPQVLAHDLLAGNGELLREARIAGRFAWIGLFMLHSDGQEWNRFQAAAGDQYALRYGDTIEVAAIAKKVLELVWAWWVGIKDYDAAQQTAAELRAKIKESDWPQ